MRCTIPRCVFVLLGALAAAAAAADGAAPAGPEPVFSRAGGFFEPPLDLEIASDVAGAVVRYTLDASEPGPEAAVYDGALALTRSCCVRARVFPPEGAPGPVRSLSFVAGRRPALPVLCVVTDPRNLHEPGRGLAANPWGRGEDWERACAVALYEPDGTRAFSEEAGLRIGGGVSRHPGFRKKSYRVYFRETYGTAALRHPVFGADGPGEFGCLRIRASGNDQFGGGPRWTLMRDVLNSALAREAGACATSWRYVVTVLNADVLGVYELREHVNATHLKTRYGLAEPELLKTSVYLGGPEHIAAKDGTRDAWMALEDFVRSADFSVPGALERVAQQVDLESLVLEHAVRLYGADWDWPQNNRYMFRDRKGADGRWRFVVWDSEWTFALGDNCAAATPMLQNYLQSTDGLRARHTFLFKKLLEDPRFRRRFVERTVGLLNTVFRPERVVARIDALAAELAPAIPLECKRWGQSEEQWRANVEVLRDFARNRPAHLLRHLASAFGEDAGTWTLEVERPDPARGAVLVGGIGIPPGDGPWTGVFLRAFSWMARAVPAPGHRFAGWAPEGLGTDAEIVLAPSLDERVLVPAGAVWKVSDAGRDAGPRWTEPIFPPEWFWREGQAPLGYGDPVRTELSFGPNPQGKHPTTYFRHTFRLAALDPGAAVEGGLVADDGAAVYVNGREVFRVNLPDGPPAYGTWARAPVGGDGETAWHRFALPPGVLEEGWNVVAVEVHQASGQSSDLRFDFALRTPAPPLRIRPLFEKE